MAQQIYTWSYATICLICFVVTLLPKFDKPEYRKVRGIMYILLGLGAASMFVMFVPMDPYITFNKGWVYGLGGYIYI